MKIAIVHDYLNQFGGAERVVQALHELWPDAPIYTSIYDAERLSADFKKMDIRTSFMQRFPFIFALFKFYLLFYPLAFESFDLSEYDLIITSSSAWAKGIKKRPGQVHLCYCYSPMRFVWRYDDYVKKESFPGWLKLVLPAILKPIRKWDLETVTGVDQFIAISATIKKRIAQIYHRESVIIYPPVETELFKPAGLDHDYFLVISRLNAYKRIDLVVEAFNQLDLPLKIIGGGPELGRLKELARPNIEFLGRLPDERVAKYLAECRALIFPGEEDFGIVPVEAMACGRPVIAYRAGGARETIVDGETGLFFERQTVEELMGAVKKFQFMTFSKDKIRRQAERFGKSVFQTKMLELVAAKMKMRGQ